MPSFVVHLLVPPLTFAALGFDRRKVLWLLPLTFLPDLDHFVGVPRASLHNLFILLVPLTMLGLTYRYPHYAHRREWAVLAFAYLGSHLLMDGFNGGWTPLFPFSEVTWLVTLYVLVRQPEHTYRVVADAGVKEGPPVLSAEYLWLSPFEVAMAAFVLTTLVAVGVRRWWRRRGAEI